VGSIIEVFAGHTALRAAPVPGTGTLRVRCARLDDCAAIRALQRNAHPGLAPWTLKQLESQRRFITNQEAEKKRVSERYDAELVKLRVLWAQLATPVSAAAASGATKR